MTPDDQKRLPERPRDSDLSVCPSLEEIRAWAKHHTDASSELAAIDPEAAWKPDRTGQSYKEIWHAVRNGHEIHPLSQQIIQQTAVPLLFQIMNADFFGINTVALAGLAALFDRSRLIALLTRGYAGKELDKIVNSGLLEGVFAAVAIDERVADDFRSQSPRLWKWMLAQANHTEHIITLPPVVAAEVCETACNSREYNVILKTIPQLTPDRLPIFLRMIEKYPMPKMTANECVTYAWVLIQLSIACRTPKEKELLRAVLEKAHTRNYWPHIENILVTEHGPLLGNDRSWEETVTSLTGTRKSDAKAEVMADHLIRVIEDATTHEATGISTNVWRQAKTVMARLSPHAVAMMHKWYMQPWNSHPPSVSVIATVCGYLRDARDAKAYFPPAICRYLNPAKTPDDQEMLEEVLCGMMEKPERADGEYPSHFPDFCYYFGLLKQHQQLEMQNLPNALEAIASCLPAMARKALECGEQWPSMQAALKNAVMVTKLDIKNLKAILELLRVGWELSLDQEGKVTERDPSATDAMRLLPTPTVWQALQRLSGMTSWEMHQPNLALAPVVRILYETHTKPYVEASKQKKSLEDMRDAMRRALGTFFADSKREWKILPGIEPFDPDLQQAVASVGATLRSRLPAHPDDVVNTNNEGDDRRLLIPDAECWKRHTGILSLLRAIFSSRERNDRAVVKRLMPSPNVILGHQQQIRRWDILQLLQAGIISTEVPPQDDLAFPPSVAKSMADLAVSAPVTFQPRALPIKDPEAVMGVAKKPIRAFWMKRLKEKAKKWLRRAALAATLTVAGVAAWQLWEHGRDWKETIVKKFSGSPDGPSYGSPPLNPGDDALDQLPEEGSKRVVFTLDKPVTGVARYMATTIDYYDRKGALGPLLERSLYLKLSEWDAREPSQEVTATFKGLQNGIEYLPLPFGVGRRAKDMNSEGEYPFPSSDEFGYYRKTIKSSLTIRYTVPSPPTPDRTSTVKDLSLAKIHPGLEHQFRRPTLSAERLRAIAPDLSQKVEALRGKPIVEIAEALQDLMHGTLTYAGNPNYAGKPLEPHLEEILKSRKTYCGPAADLYIELLRHLGVSCVKVRGYFAAEGQTEITGADAHAWVAVVHLEEGNKKPYLAIYDPTPSQEEHKKNVRAKKEAEMKRKMAATSHPGVAEAYLLLLALIATERALRKKKKSDEAKQEAPAEQKQQKGEQGAEKNGEEKDGQETREKQQTIQEQLTPEPLPDHEAAPLELPPPPEYQDEEPKKPLVQEVDDALLSAFDGAYHGSQSIPEEIIAEEDMRWRRCEAFQEAQKTHGATAKNLTDLMMHSIAEDQREYPAMVVAGWLAGALSSPEELYRRITDMKKVAEVSPRASRMLQLLANGTESIKGLPDQLREAFGLLKNAGGVEKFRLKENPEADLRAFLKLWEWKTAVE